MDKSRKIPENPVRPGKIPASQYFLGHAPPFKVTYELLPYLAADRPAGSTSTITSTYYVLKNEVTLRI